MKPDVIMFGEFIPVKALEEAEDLAQRCDVVLVIGTSAQVYPAAQLPGTAKESGAFIIEINVEETEFTPTITDIFLKGQAAGTLPELVSCVKA
jgi:NAD-dependent deacetylase